MSVSESSDSKAPAGSEEALKECNRLDADLAALRVAYEHYFLGMERKPPKQLHEAIKSKMKTLKVAPFVRGASARFRIEGLHNKLLAYERMWSRTLYEIENGIYRRDVFKARRRAKEREESPRSEARSRAPAEPPESITEIPKIPGAPSAPSSKPVLKSVSPGTPRAEKSDDGAALSDAKVKAIYDAYVSAKKKCNEDVSKISVASLGKTLRKQIPELIKQHQAKTVEFKIVIKDGKAVLKAVPR